MRPAHATRPTPHGASRLVQPTSAWSVKARRALSRHCRDARVYGHTTTAMLDIEYTPASPDRLFELDISTARKTSAPKRVTDLVEGCPKTWRLVLAPMLSSSKSRSAGGGAFTRIITVLPIKLKRTTRAVPWVQTEYTCFCRINPGTPDFVTLLKFQLFLVVF